MSMPISRCSILTTLLVIATIAGCSGQPDNQQLATVEAEQTVAAAAAGRVYCALGGAVDFALNCTMEQIAGREGTILVIGRADAGYRRFRITNDGRGVEAADGAETATVTLIDDGMIEVTVAGDRYRLPASERTSFNGSSR